jgi:hypothetical protein
LQRLPWFSPLPQISYVDFGRHQLLYSCISSWNRKVEGSYAYPVFCSRNFVFNSSLSGNHHQSIASLFRKMGIILQADSAKIWPGFKSEGSKFLKVYEKCVTIISIFFLLILFHHTSKHKVNDKLF